MDIKDFLEFLYEKTIDTTIKGNKTIYDVVSSKPQEKTDTSNQEELYSSIKKEILFYVHKQFTYTIKKLLHDYNIPNDIKNQWEQQLLVPIGQISKEQNLEYAKQISSIYTIFKKYVETKQNFSKKVTTKQEQQLPIADVKAMINQGKSLGDIADKYNMPKSSIAFKLKSMYQTSYSDIKKQLGK